ncbi:MAG: hypothetical protein ACLRSE_01495 [Alistipes finegoldii]
MKKLLVSVIALLATVSLSAQDLTAVYNEGCSELSETRTSREPPQNSKR